MFLDQFVDQTITSWLRKHGQSHELKRREWFHGVYLATVFGQFPNNRIVTIIRNRPQTPSCVDLVVAGVRRVSSVNLSVCCLIRTIVKFGHASESLANPTIIQTHFDTSDV